MLQTASQRRVCVQLDPYLVNNLCPKHYRSTINALYQLRFQTFSAHIHNLFTEYLMG